MLTDAGPTSAVLAHIDPERGIDFRGILELDHSPVLREMVKVGWALFNGRAFDDAESESERIRAPHFDDIACRLDIQRFRAVLDATVLRRGMYREHEMEPSTPTQRRAYLAGGYQADLVDRLEREAGEKRAQTRGCRARTPAFCTGSRRSRTRWRREREVTRERSAERVP